MLTAIQMKLLLWWGLFKSYYKKKNAEYEHSMFKDGFGWALAQYYHGGWKINELIGYYETAKANDYWSPFYDGVKAGCEHIQLENPTETTVGRIV